MLDGVQRPPLSLPLQPHKFEEPHMADNAQLPEFALSLDTSDSDGDDYEPPAKLDKAVQDLGESVGDLPEPHPLILSDGDHLTPCLEQFFSDDSGESFLINLPSSVTTFPLARVHTNASLETVLPTSDILALSLSDLCDIIAQHRSLQQAQIVTSEGFTVRSGAVVHRFLVLQLRRTERRTIWLRLDRLRSAQITTLGFLRSGASTPANDTARLSVGKEDLVGAGRLESRQVFKTTPTLGDLRHLFHVIRDELQRYELWPANCWFFVSLLQQHLGSAGDGSFIKGSLPHPSLAQDIRDRIIEKLKSSKYLPRAPRSLTEEILDAQARFPIDWDISTVLTLSRKWDAQNFDDWTVEPILLLRLVRDYAAASPLWHKEYACTLLEYFVRHIRASVTDSRLVQFSSYDVAKTLDVHGRLLFDLSRPEDALISWSEALPGYRHTCTSKESSECDAAATELLALLAAYSDALRDLERVEEACTAMGELVSLKREQNINDPETRTSYVQTLRRYGDLLHQVHRVDEAREAWAEPVTIYRRLLGEDYDQSHHDLASALRMCSDSLLKAGYLDEAQAAISEATAIHRALHAGAPERWGREHLAGALRVYALFLSKAGLVKDACAAWEEPVAIYRSLCAESLSQHQFEFTRALREYRADLHSASRFKDASTASAELVSVFRSLHTRHPTLYANNLAWALSLLGESLSKATRLDEACDAYAEAVEHYRALYERERMYRPTLVPALADYACALFAASRVKGEENLEAARDAVQLARKIDWLTAKPGRLRTALRDLGRVAMQYGEYDLALGAIVQATRLAAPDAESESKLLEDDLQQLESECRLKLSQL